jgi:hypothetical protein
MIGNNDILYIDWDIHIDKPLTFNNNGLPSMVYHQGQPDNCLMYSPDKKVFLAYEVNRIKRKIAFETHGWFRKVLRDQPINEIKDGFTHLRSSGYAELCKQYGSLHKGEQYDK